MSEEHFEKNSGMNSKSSGREISEETLEELKIQFDKKLGMATQEQKFEQAGAYGLTHQTMVHITKSTYISASRGFGRELAPSRKTTPGLLQRRYSVDADSDPSNYTLDQSDIADRGPFQRKLVEADGMIPGGLLNETDFPVPLERKLALPCPSRYGEILRLASPPHDDQIFIEMKKSSLRNEDVCHIMTRSGTDSWWADNTLNVALELLEKFHDVDAHGIAFANSMVASIFSILGHEGFVDNSEELAHFREYKDQFQDKKWIFLPVNDGFRGEYSASSNGIHWAFVLVNRIHRVAIYFDSLFAAHGTYQGVARAVADGLGSILGEQYRFMVDSQTPNQVEANNCNDDGACGPFVINLVDWFAHKISTMQSHGRADHDIVVWCDPWTMQNFHFDSSAIRKYIYRLVWDAKTQECLETARREHDKISLEGLPEHVQVGEIPVWVAPDRAASRKSSDSSVRSRKADGETEDEAIEPKRRKTNDEDDSDMSIDDSDMSISDLASDESTSSEELSVEHIQLDSSRNSPEHNGTSDKEHEDHDRPDGRLGDMLALLDDELD